MSGFQNRLITSKKLSVRYELIRDAARRSVKIALIIYDVQTNAGSIFVCVTAYLCYPVSVMSGMTNECN